jgi:hypothetical protein
MYVFWDGQRKLPRQQVRNLPDGVTLSDAIEKDPELRTTGWYELVDELPQDFIERFPRLLGPAEISFDDTDGRLHKKYLAPDFSPSAIRQELVNQMKFSARHTLAQTDWMVVRGLETSVPVSAEIKAERSRIRDLTRWYEDQISKLPVTELADYTWTFQPPHPSAPHSHPVDLPPGVVMVSEEGLRQRVSRAGGPEIPETPLPQNEEVKLAEVPLTAPGPDRRG